ncbi:MAG: hypothetical protein OEV91_10895, partial [Desulfobulbaceae bacterium]|nr:hypothetical protein [Desulfobulbaceae bacterium]
MSRNILIVDHSGTIRRILRTMILANINDAEVAEAPDTAKAMHRLAEGNTHLVLFSWESADDQWFDFIKKSRTASGSQRLNFILFTSRPDDRHLARVKEAGVAAQLFIPCTPAILTETVNRACNPTLLRESRRYNIPEAEATLNQGAISLDARVINISQGGMLCELPIPEHIDWSVPLLATVSFP